MYDLQILAEAHRELDKEIAYSIDKWGKIHARKYAQTLRKQIRNLRDNPHLHPLRNDILPGIRIITYKGNRIIYTIRENQKLVVVLAVLNNYQNIDRTKLEMRGSGK